jgi:hypothetical protein
MMDSRVLLVGLLVLLSSAVDTTLACAQHEDCATDEYCDTTGGESVAVDCISLLFKRANMKTSPSIGLILAC